MQKIKFFNVKWTFKEIFFTTFTTFKKYILEKFQCNPLIKFSFDDVSFKFFWDIF